MPDLWISSLNAASCIQEAVHQENEHQYLHCTYMGFPVCFSHEKYETMMGITRVPRAPRENISQCRLEKLGITLWKGLDVCSSCWVHRILIKMWKLRRDYEKDTCTKTKLEKLSSTSLSRRKNLKGYSDWNNGAFSTVPREGGISEVMF